MADQFLVVGEEYASQQMGLDVPGRAGQVPVRAVPGTAVGGVATVETFSMAGLNVSTYTQPANQFFGGWILPPSPMELIRAVAYLTAPPPAGQVALAVYDELGAFVAVTPAVSAGVGALLLDFVAPAVLVAGTVYYFGVWSDVGVTRVNESYGNPYYNNAVYSNTPGGYSDLLGPQTFGIATNVPWIAAGGE